MENIQVYETGLSLATRHWYTILSPKSREKAWSRNILVHHKRSSSKVSPLPKNLVNLLLGYEEGYFGTLSNKRTKC
jgi:hypothetical protein